MRNALYVPSGLIVYLVITGLLHATAHAKATKNDDELVFGPTPMVRSLLVVLILGFAAAAIYVSLTTPSSLLGTIIFGSISIAGTLAFPPNILVTASGVASVKWWGKKTVVFWRSVSRIEYHKGPAATVVVGQHGARVVHSGWNRDTSGFLLACEEKTGLSPTISEL